MIGGEPRIVVEHVTKLRDQDSPSSASRAAATSRSTASPACGST
ncbi:MAG: hypothetical protein R3E53_02730 [Myxococcota bacterium]